MNIEKLLRNTGRFLLGLYFVVPGLMKVLGWSGTSSYMALHGVPFIPVLLALTIVFQVGGGAMLMFGIRPQLTALLLAGLTVAINLFMHDFWNTYEGVDVAHETQNFVKNLGIMAGLLYVAGSPERPDTAAG